MTSPTTTLKNVFLSPDDRELVEAVINAACIFFQVERDELIAGTKLAKSRHLCFYIISNNTHLNEKTIGAIFGKGRTAVQYGISQTQVHKKIYRQTLGSINGIVAIANTFDKKHTWHIH